MRNIQYGLPLETRIANLERDIAQGSLRVSPQEARRQLAALKAERKGRQPSTLRKARNVVLSIFVIFALAAPAVAMADQPSSPPGQGECQHGNSGKPCKDDPQPSNGKDCEEHGPKEGGVNEDHCSSAPPTPSTTPSPSPSPTSPEPSPSSSPGGDPSTAPSPRPTSEPSSNSGSRSVGTLPQTDTASASDVLSYSGYPFGLTLFMAFVVAIVVGYGAITSRIRSALRRKR